jgi:hypothetical protein
MLSKLICKLHPFIEKIGVVYRRIKFRARQQPITFYIDCKVYQYYATEMEQDWEILWAHLNGVSVTCLL